MTVPVDPSPALQQYAHPEKLVTTDWLAENLGQVGSGDLVVVESDEDVLLYETGHIPGAVKVDWHLDLNDPVTRDYVDGEGFAKLMDASGISRDTTVVVYGDKSNWWAAYALWVFELFGHPDVRLLDGGRAAWEAEGREMTLDRPAITAPAASPGSVPRTSENTSAASPTNAIDSMARPTRASDADKRSTRSLRWERNTARWIITGASRTTVEARASDRTTR